MSCVHRSGWKAIATAHPPAMTLTVLHATPKVVFSTMLRRVGHLLLSHLRTESPIEAQRLSWKTSYPYDRTSNFTQPHHPQMPSSTKSCNHLMPRMSSGQVANPVPKSCNRPHTAPCRSTCLDPLRSRQGERASSSSHTASDHNLPQADDCVHEQRSLDFSVKSCCRPRLPTRSTRGRRGQIS